MIGYLARFQSIAAAQPNAIAVDEDGRSTSYADLLALGLVYARLVSRHVECPKVVIHLAAGADAYAAMFGVGLAGGVYAPVNTMLPAEKRRRVLEIFRPDMVISSRSDATELDIPQDRIVDPGELTDAAPVSMPVPEPASRQPAYVIFTSGSTGAPKGVAIGRDALDHYVDWIGTAIGPTGADRWSQHPNIGFDLSVMDIYGALCFGAALVPLQSKLDRLMPGQAIGRQALTIWNSVPSVVDIMIRARQLTPDNLATLRLATFCGEPLRRDHLEALFAARPDLTVFNTYGPTEATVSCTLRTIRKPDIATVCRSSVALGAAIPGMSLQLVGGATRDEGEIVLSGPQLADGYWQDQAQTDRYFGQSSIEGSEQRIYRTGDWAVLERGELFFVGRLDNQVKIKGHRLDLAEVDAALVGSGAESACCVYQDDELHAFVQASTTERIDEEALRQKLADYLEPHAIPKFIHLVDHLPRNDNDKIDRGALQRKIASEARQVSG